MRLLMTAGLVEEYVLDHSTTPDVVMILKESNMARRNYFDVAMYL
jgi:hypothetical protein